MSASQQVTGLFEEKIGKGCTTATKSVYTGVMENTQTTQPTPIDELIVGKTYIITTFVVDEPHKEMRATILNTTHEDFTADTTSIVGKVHYMRTVTLTKLSRRCWTFTEVIK